MVRSSRGRQRLEMVKIPNDSNLMVTFSKRRSGLFKKASELSTLCGAEVTLIVFSPGKKVFSFGHPSVEKVVEQYLSGSTPPRPSGACQLVEAHRNARICDLSMNLTQLQEELEMEKKRGEELDNLRKASQSQYWWDRPIQELTLAQLEQFKAALLDLKQNLVRQAQRVLLQNSAPQPFFSPNPGTAGILPFDNRNTGFNSNMAVAPFSSNTTMAPFNTNMPGPPFDANMAGAPFDANMTGAPYAYTLGYGNGFF
ncbi:MADS BOX PROTEIN [Salix koriyanagi]|uniref:MADS BOX PROTEIN n=1 Tax=Salix koriyanagi TaxID=2511006 RepID=A0A9Q0UP29_9ROSI|nr:MADS BOX PROTEIN [Salix koriyanagi]